MNLQPMHPTPREGDRVTCFSCMASVPSRTVLCDLNGPAFIAYYCAPCAAKEEFKLHLCAIVEEE